MEHLETSVVLIQGLKADQQTKLLFLEVPTLDFLLRKHIIKMSDEWEPEEEMLPENNPLSFSKSILFHNKMRITSAFEKLVIYQDMKSKQSLDDLQQISIKILDKIKDAEYAGIGINFLSILESKNPGEEITNRFLKAISNLPADKIIGGSVSYVYPKDDVQVTATISPVKKATDSSTDGTAISFAANYHFGAPYIKKMQEFIKRMPSLKDDYLEQSKALFG